MNTSVAGSNTGPGYLLSYVSLLPPADGDVNNGWSLLTASIILTTASLLVVVLRMYARIKIVDKVGPDDYTMLAAMAITIAGMVFAIEEVTYGAGRHLYYLSLPEKSHVIMYNHFEEMQNLAATCLVKVSVCLFILRLLAGVNGWKLRWTLYTLIAWMTTVTILTFIGILVECIPISSAWDPTVQGDCASDKRVYVLGYILGVTSVLTDIACSAFPIIVFSKLQIDRRTKVALCCLMSLGLFASACCVAKTILLTELDNNDFTYSLITVDICAAAEANIGIIAASIPGLQPLFKSYFSVHSRPGNNSNINKDPLWWSLPSLFTKVRSKIFRSANDDATSELGVLPLELTQFPKATDIVEREIGSGQRFGIHDTGSFEGEYHRITGTV
ncbi:hypothetical protein MMC18_008979 [Xylographa bjoerkii]|nr:hypothetical protein [Xylographa bjoerkii]